MGWIFLHNLHDVILFNTRTEWQYICVYSPPELQARPSFVQTSIAFMSRPPSSHANSRRSLGSPTRLILRPTGTDAFPSILDSLEAEHEEVRDSNTYIDDHLVETPASPALAASHYLEPAEHESDVHTPSSPRVLSPLPTGMPKTKPSDGFIQRAKRFGGHVKQLVTRRKESRHGNGLNGCFSSKNADRRSVGGPVSLIGSVPLYHAVERRGSDEMSCRAPADQYWSKHISSTNGSISKHEGRMRKSLRRLSLAG